MARGWPRKSRGLPCLRFDLKDHVSPWLERSPFFLGSGLLGYAPVPWVWQRVSRPSPQPGDHRFGLRLLLHPQPAAYR